MRPDWRWSFPIAALATMALAVVIAPLFTGSYDSTTESLVRTLHVELLVVAVPLGVGVELALFYAMFKFRGNDDPKPTPHDRDLEVALVVGTALVLVFVGATSYLVLADPMVSTTPDAEPQPGDVHVEVTGQNWYWEFSYPGENVTTRNTLVVPVNETLFLTVESRDVIHSVHVPGLGIKQDAIPGQTTSVRTRPTDTGTYRLYCAEFCGTGHSKMVATVRVVSQSEYEAWLAEQRNASGNRTANQSANATANQTVDQNATANQSANPATTRSATQSVAKSATATQSVAQHAAATQFVAQPAAATQSVA